MPLSSLRYINKPNSTMKKIKLSEDIKYWRAERPDEWTMDEFVRAAQKLERELVELKAQQGDVERSNARFNWLLAYHNSTVGAKGLQPLSLKCLDEEFLSYNH